MNGHRRVLEPDRSRNTALSQAASPARATATARSSTILPGSCVASGRRHGLEPGRELLHQPAAPGRLDQQRTAGGRHQRLAAGDHGRPEDATCGVPLTPDRSWPRQPRSDRAGQAFPCVRARVSPTRISSDESPRLGNQVTSTNASRIACGIGTTERFSRSIYTCTQCPVAAADSLSSTKRPRW
jgi:hypothetical protein